MNGPLAIGTAFGGGILSFASPCVIPLVPVYLSNLGLRFNNNSNSLSNGAKSDVPDLGKTRFLINSIGFVVGITTTFTLLSLGVTGLSYALKRNTQVLDEIAGALILFFALFILLSQTKYAKFLNFERRIIFRKSSTGLIQGLLLGLAFGLSWTPCITPILGSILALAATTSNVIAGVILLVFYGLGVGTPFIAFAFLLDRFPNMFSKLKNLGFPLTIAGSILLFVLGLLLLLGRFTLINMIINTIL